MTDLLNTTAAARLLGVSRSRISFLIRSGRLPAAKPGTEWLIDPAVLAAFQRQPPGWPKGRRRKT